MRGVTTGDVLKQLREPRKGPDPAGVIDDPLTPPIPFESFRVIAPQQDLPMGNIRLYRLDSTASAMLNMTVIINLGVAG